MLFCFLCRLQQSLNRFIWESFVLFFSQIKSTNISNWKLHAIVDKCRAGEPLKHADGMRAASVCEVVANEISSRCMITHSADVIQMESGFIFAGLLALVWLINSVRKWLDSLTRHLLLWLSVDLLSLMETTAQRLIWTVWNSNTHSLFKSQKIKWTDRLVGFQTLSIKAKSLKIASHKLNI